LTKVDFELNASGGDDAKLSVVETIVPVGASQSVFDFDLDTVRYVGEGASVGTREERLVSVADEAGRPLSFHHKSNDLLVELPEPAPPDKPVKLRFTIEGNFLIRPGGDNFWELGSRPWFPQTDLAGEYYTLHALVRVKKPFVAFAPGTTVRRAVEGDTIGAG